MTIISPSYERDNGDIKSLDSNSIGVYKRKKVENNQSCIQLLKDFFFYLTLWKKLKSFIYQGRFQHKK